MTPNDFAKEENKQDYYRYSEFVKQHEGWQQIVSLHEQTPGETPKQELKDPKKAEADARKETLKQKMREAKREKEVK